jgi:chemotaxis protein methyltransferase WspC
MKLIEVEHVLKRTMGLDAASIGSASVERAVRIRMSACQTRDLPAYVEQLRSDQTELQELVEAVVVSETWFFRDREAFTAVARIARESALPSPADGMRLLSLPCSTGEEPFSLAMALLDAGLPSSRFRIDAIDISERALNHARRAIYGKNSFRGGDLAFRDRYFAPRPEGYHLADQVRRSVRFAPGNLFAGDFLPGTEIYDVIFCRNMLIYFDGPAQAHVIGVLTRLLTTNGVLFVGPSEASLLLNPDYVSTRIPMAFAFRKAARVALEQATPTKAIPVGPRSTARRRTVSPLRAVSGSSADRPAVVPQATAAGDAKPEIHEIRRLADGGHLVEAARHCEEYLRAGEPSAEVLHLLGVIRDAAGNQAEAGDYYRKALYLDPNHHEALVHLALLLGKRGDAAGAKVLNDRVRRLARRESR